MNKEVIRQLYKKEMLDVLRDKKTVLMMLVIPLLVYPLLFVAGAMMMTKVATQLETQTYQIAIDFEDTDGRLQELFELENEQYSFELVDAKKLKQDYETALRNETLDAVVSMSMEDGKPVFQISYLSSVTNSSYAVSKIEEVLKLYSTELTEKKLAKLGLDSDEYLEPIEITYNNVSSTEEATGNLLGTILPFMLVVSLLMGTMYPAIDTTAGERERGTLETLLTLPITNKELIVSKFLTVATIGVVSAILNLVSMGGIGVYLYKLSIQMGQMQEQIRLGRFVPVLLVSLICILAFAVLLSALSMCSCVFARTYKEANNYITPFMLIVMFASFVAFLPNIQLSGSVALIPVANVCLLIRDLLVFKFSWSVIGIVLISNVAYGMLAIMLLAKLYNSEQALFGDGTGAMRIFERRRNMKQGGVPSVGDACFVLPVVFVLILYLGGLLSVKHPYVALVMVQVIILTVPFLVTVYTKRSVKATFRFRLCSWKHFFGGAVLMIGTMLLGQLVTMASSSIFTQSAKSMSDSMQGILELPAPIVFLMVAVLPAICEEMLFRGYLLSAFEAKMKAKTAVILVAAIFGIYHMNLVQSITTALIGLAICYVSYKSGSIFPGMLMHAINNGIACWISLYPTVALRWLPFFATTGNLWKDVAAMAIIGSLCMGIGVGIINHVKKC